jgi:hypothetical protein
MKRVSRLATTAVLSAGLTIAGMALAEALFLQRYGAR